jgi:exodeoxyribonuclease VII large subunit
VQRGLDAIVVIRGGGSRNALATFDTETIARAIAAAPVPVLTGLGHEVDRSIADEVAHTSLKTPTACAAHLVSLVHRYLGDVEERHGTVLAVARGRLDDADRRLGERAHRIARRTHAAVERADERLGTRVHRLRAAGVRPVLDAERRVRTIADRLATRVPQLLAAEERHLHGIEARVRALDPVNVLARGWSITRGPDGTIVRSPGDVAAGDVLTTELAGGAVRSRVEPGEPSGSSSERSTQIGEPSESSSERSAQIGEPSESSSERSAQMGEPSESSSERSAQLGEPSESSSERSAQIGEPSGSSSERSTPNGAAS